MESIMIKNSRHSRRPLAWHFRLAAVLAGLLLSGYVRATTTVVLSPVPKLQFFDASGRALAFGCVFSYQTLSSTPLATYTDYSGVVANANPLVLTAGGYVGTGGLWLQAGLAYRLVVKSAGGTNCATGSTISTVDGIGGGTTTLTTMVTYSATPTFAAAAQNQLFEITLTGNATSQPLTAVGITPPAIFTWEITQDGSGAHTFTWPSNTLGGSTISAGANTVTQQSFIWNGSEAIAMGPATYDLGAGVSAFGVTDLYDFGLTASSVLCTDSTKKLTSSGCGSFYTVTYNGQAVAAGGSGNVNSGAANHSVAINKGAGSAIGGVALSNDQVLQGSTGADPAASALTNCPIGNVSYATSTHVFGCAPSVVSAVIQTISGDTTIGSGADGTWITKAVTMPSSGCPCRAFVSYGMFYTSTNAGAFEAWIDDGTNQFGTSQENQTGANATGSGLAASSYSTGTYSNSAAITFSGKAHPTSAGGMTVTANARPGPQTSWLNVVIFTSN